MAEEQAPTQTPAAPAAAPAETAPQPQAAPATPASATPVPGSDSTGTSPDTTQPGAQNFAAAQQATESATKLAAQPITPAPVPGVATGPHARLVNMIQGLALGVDAFGKAIATHGEEGGVKEVREEQQRQQQLQMAAKQQAQQEREAQLNTYYKVADTNMRVGQMAMLTAKFPMEMQQQQAALSDSMIKLYDELGVPRSFSVPYVLGQPMSGHVEAVGAAAGGNGGLSKNLVTTAHDPAGKGYNTGEGQTVGHGVAGLMQTVIPQDDPRAKQTLTLAQAQLDNFGEMLGKDNPAVQSAQSTLDQIKSTNGAGMNLLNFGVALQQLMVVPAQLIAQKQATMDFESKKATLAKTTEEAKQAALPKNLEEATAMSVSAKQKYASDPTTENKKAMDDAEEQRAAAYKDKLDELKEQTKITAGASGKGVEGMINTGIDPITKEKLTVDNAPDEMLIDARTGNPIPIKMMSTLKPTQQESNRADFAASALHTLSIIDKLKAEGKLPNGPISGLTAQKLAAVGLGDKSQEGIDLLGFASSASTGAHVGGRFNIEIMNKMDKMLNMNMNDAQFAAAEQAIRDVMEQYVEQGGRMTVAQWKSMTPDEQKAMLHSTVQASLGGGKSSSAANPAAKYGGVPLQ